MTGQMASQPNGQSASHTAKWLLLQFGNGSQQTQTVIKVGKKGKTGPTWNNNSNDGNEFPNNPCNKTHTEFRYLLAHLRKQYRQLQLILYSTSNKNNQNTYTYTRLLSSWHLDEFLFLWVPGLAAG